MQRLLGRFLQAAGLVGVLLCIVGIVGCWWLHVRLGQRLDRLFARVDGALAVVNGDILRVLDELQHVRSELEIVRQGGTGRVAGPSNDKAARRPVVGTAVADIGRQLSEAKPRLVQAVEFGRVASGLLDALAELWLADRAGFDTDRLNDAADQLTVLVEIVQKLATAIDEPTGAGTPEEPSRASELVGRIIAILDRAAEQSESARGRVADRQAGILGDINATAVISTVIMVWIGLGQLSLTIHGRTLVRRGNFGTSVAGA